MIKYIAKSNKSKTHTETIEEHTNKLLKLFDDFKKSYSSKFDDKELNLIETACKLHDLGKMNYKFQEYIQKDYPTNKKLNDLYNELNIRDIPHGILSCCFIDIANLQKEFGFDDIDIKVLATSIFNHHNRELLDNNKQRIEFKRLNRIVNEDLKYNVEKYNEIYNKNLHCEIDGMEENMIINNECKRKNHYEFWLKFIVIKGMLNKIDYAASAFVYNKKENKYEFGISKDDFEITADNSCEKVITKFKENQYKLNDCQKFMKGDDIDTNKDDINKKRNIIVIASTGIGKTEGALLWAGDSKTFYTLPIKVSITAIYERIRYENYYDKEKITILHSDAISEIMKEDTDFEDAMEKYGKSKKLSYPFTVCTVDQLFYFVFKSLGTEIFPATLKYSKIIIDEIQSYTPEITAFILYGLKVINDLGGQFCIMTATLPPIIKELMERENIKFETPKIFIKKDENGNSIKRHFIKFIQFENGKEKDFNYNEILENAKNKKVLIICNMVRRSQDVYKKLKEQNKQNIEINLLHSRFIFNDRKDREIKIQKFASTKEEERNNDAGIWISTQIVEASLDIDFDVLYTDMCAADSLLQRMGRCYRNRIYEKDEPNIFIYDTKVGVGTEKESVYNLELYERAVNFIKEYDNNIFTEEQKLEYIDKVYNTEELKKVKSSYLQSIDDNYEKLKRLSPAFIEKSQAADLFRAIDSVTVIPEEIYFSEITIINEYFELRDKEKKTIDDLKNLIKKKNEILGFTTSVRLYKSLKSSAGIKPIELGKNKFDKIYIVNLEYDKELGLLDTNIFLND